MVSESFRFPITLFYLVLLSSCMGGKEFEGVLKYHARSETALAIQMRVKWFFT